MTMMNLINYERGKWSFTSRYIYVVILLWLFYLIYLIMSFHNLIEYSSNDKFIMSFRCKCCEFVLSKTFKKTWFSHNCFVKCLILIKNMSTSSSCRNSKKPSKADPLNAFAPAKKGNKTSQTNNKISRSSKVSW